MKRNAEDEIEITEDEAWRIDSALGIVANYWERLAREEHPDALHRIFQGELEATVKLRGLLAGLL